MKIKSLILVSLLFISIISSMPNLLQEDFHSSKSSQSGDMKPELINSIPDTISLSTPLTLKFASTIDSKSFTMLNISWGDGYFSESNMLENTHYFSQLGALEIRVIAKFEDGNYSDELILNIVVEDVALEAVITHENQFYQHGEIKKSSCTDSTRFRLGVVTCEWYVNGELISNESLFEHIYPNKSVSYLTLIVYDEKGQNASFSEGLFQSSTHDGGIIDWFWLESPFLYEGSRVYFYALPTQSYEDLSCENLTIEDNFDGEWHQTQNYCEDQSDYHRLDDPRILIIVDLPTVKGNYSIKISATLDGITDSEILNFTVIDNPLSAYPMKTDFLSYERRLFSVSGLANHEMEELVFNYTIYDAEGNKYSEGLDQGSYEIFFIPLKDFQFGEYRGFFSIKDNDSSFSFDFNFSVSNDIPDVRLDCWDLLELGDTLDCNIFTDDAHFGNEGGEYIVQMNGKDIQTHDGKLLFTPSKPGVYKLEVSYTDPHGASGTDSYKFSLEGDDPEMMRVAIMAITGIVAVFAVMLMVIFYLVFTRKKIDEEEYQVKWDASNSLLTSEE